MEVTVYGPLRSATGSKTVALETSDTTFGGVLEEFLAAYPRARPHLLDDDGDVRPSVRVTCDGERVDLDDDCPRDATLQLFPAMAGGGARAIAWD